MICVHDHPVLLITPTGCIQAIQAAYAEERWLVVKIDSVGDALRQVRKVKPEVLVLDISMYACGSTEIDMALRVVHEVRRRISGQTIVVLGAGDDAAMEQAARTQGATLYLAISGATERDVACRHIQSLQVRDGPTNAHGPPRSGVPPR